MPVQKNDISFSTPPPSNGFFVSPLPHNKAEGGDVRRENKIPNTKDRTPLPVKAKQIATKLLEEGIMVLNKVFYCYREGIWERIPDSKAYAVIDFEWSQLWGASRQSERSEVIAHLEIITSYLFYDCKNQHPKNTIFTNSGKYNLDKGELMPYERNDFLFSKLPFDVIENVDAQKEAPEFLKFITSSLGDQTDDYRDTVTFVMEWIGYCIFPDNPFANALILHGEGANGKGVLMKIIRGMLGEQNCSLVDIGQINDRSELFLTEHKMVNFAEDVDSFNQLDTGIMKVFVEGGEVVANEKHKPQRQIICSAKLIIAANDLPFSRNPGMAIKRRFMMLPFLRSFRENERDPYLLEKIKPEFQFIFSSAIKHLKNLLKRGYFVPPERSINLFGRYEKENDSVRQWIEADNKQGTDDDRLKRPDAKVEYVKFCRESNLKPLSPLKFFERMRILGFETKKLNGEVYYVGVKAPTNATLAY